MKKLTISLLVLCAICFNVTILESCSKSSTVAADPAAVCTASANSFTTAYTAYVNAPTDKTKCQGFKDAANKYLTDCSTFATAADLKSARNDVASIVCQ
jgi:hypothetical protein